MLIFYNSCVIQIIGKNLCNHIIRHSIITIKPQQPFIIRLFHNSITSDISADILVHHHHLEVLVLVHNFLDLRKCLLAPINPQQYLPVVVVFEPSLRHNGIQAILYVFGGFPRRYAHAHAKRVFGNR